MSRRKPFKQFVHLDDNPPGHITYEVHLDPPYIPKGADDDPSKWVAHYIGSAERERLMGRLFEDHGTSGGARVLQVQKEAGGSWHLVRTWPGGRDKEVQLKQQSGVRYCPECTPQPKQGDSEPAGNYRTRRQRREAQRAREAPESGPGAEMQMKVAISEAKLKPPLAREDVEAVIQRIEKARQMPQRQLELEAG